MKKTILGIVLAIAAPIVAIAQDTTATKADTSYWHKGTTLALNLSQTSLTNWNAGGQNAIAFNGLSTSFLRYEKARTVFSNDLTMAIGYANIANVGWRKTDDRFYYVGKLSYKKSEKLRYTIYLDFLTQFANGFNYVKSATDPTKEDEVLVSQFLSRGFSTLALGAEYTPVKGLFVFFSPVTMRTTIVGNQTFANAGAFGVRPQYLESNGNRVAGKNFLFEPGALLDITYKRDIAKNITLATKATFFWSYLRKNYDIDKATGILNSSTYQFYKNVDVMWDLSIIMKVSKYITASVTTSLIYDDDIKVLRTKYADDPTNPRAVGPATQFKQVLGLGLQATFKSKFAK